MNDPLSRWELRIYRFGVFLLAVVSFLAFITHELWRIIKPFLSP